MYVTFDIETTGLTAQDEITSIAFYFSNTDKYVVLQHLNGSLDSSEASQLPNQIEDEIKSELGVDNNLAIGRYNCEDDLLDDIRRVIADYINLQSQKPVFVGFNSDKFDIPHLRTRSLLTDTEWPLRNCESLDLMKLFEYKFQTSCFNISGLNKPPLRKFGAELGIDVKSSMNKSKIKGKIEDHGYARDEVQQYLIENDLDTPTKSESSLEGLHGLFGERELASLDPFEDSSEVVDAFHNEEFGAILKHNLIDVMMTYDLLSIAQSYIPRSEIRKRQL